MSMSGHEFLTSMTHSNSNFQRQSQKKIKEIALPPCQLQFNLGFIIHVHDQDNFEVDIHNHMSLIVRIQIVHLSVSVCECECEQFSIHIQYKKKKLLLKPLKWNNETMHHFKVQQVFS